MTISIESEKSSNLVPKASGQPAIPWRNTVKLGKSRWHEIVILKLSNARQNLLSKDPMPPSKTVERRMASADGFR